MPRICQLAAVFAVLALAAASAQQPESPAKPVAPRSPTYPTPAPVANPPTPAPAPQFGVIGPAPNFTGNTGTLDPAGYTVGRRVFEAGRATRRGTCTRPGSWCSERRDAAACRFRGSRSRRSASARAPLHPRRLLPLARRRPERELHDDVHHDGAEQDFAR